MDGIGDLLPHLFYAATLAALGFFLHKVLWLVQYKRLQRRIVDDAVRRLREGNATDAAEWEAFARSCWSRALGRPDAEGPSAFLRGVEEDLARVRAGLCADRRSVEQLLADTLAGRPVGGVDPDTRRIEVLSLPRPGKAGEGRRVTLRLDFPPIVLPRPPDPRLYELTVRSRYGLLRRALVFFSGVADVVYSSQHVATMSQNVHVPTAVLVRRLSLVLLVIAVVLVDMIFGARRFIGEATDAWVRGVLLAPGERGLVADHLGTALGFAAWAAIYGSIYLALYLSIRRRYEARVRRLRRLREDESAILRRLYRRHLGELVRWAHAYGRSLDGAIEITASHAGMLIDHYAHRLRRRVADEALLRGAKAIADSLFLRLPEARGDLQDAATTHRHSLVHHLWPRADEMEYQVRLAQYRAAWQALEIAVRDLRREQPDPNQSHELWKTATLYAIVFAPLVPSGLADELRQAYAQMVTECVTATDRDLAELDGRLGELERGLADRLEAARPLVEARIEIANGQIQAALAAHCAALIDLREQARLEAMAFEI